MRQFFIQILSVFGCILLISTIFTGTPLTQHPTTAETTTIGQPGFDGYLTENTDLTYAGSRNYDLKTGCFDSIDPFYPISSPYRYCFGNPVMLRDPSGLDPLPPPPDDCYMYWWNELTDEWEPIGQGVEVNPGIHDSPSYGGNGGWPGSSGTNCFGDDSTTGSGGYGGAGVAICSIDIWLTKVISSTARYNEIRNDIVDLWKYRSSVYSSVLNLRNELRLLEEQNLLIEKTMTPLAEQAITSLEGFITEDNALRSFVTKNNLIPRIRNLLPIGRGCTILNPYVFIAISAGDVLSAAAIYSYYHPGDTAGYTPPYVIRGPYGP